MTQSIVDAPAPMRRAARTRNGWFGDLVDLVRSTRPVCTAIAPRPLLGTALAVGLLLTSEILVRIDELVCSLIGLRDAGSC